MTFLRQLKWARVLSGTAISFVVGFWIFFAGVAYGSLLAVFMRED